MTYEETSFIPGQTYHYSHPGQRSHEERFNNKVFFDFETEAELQRETVCLINIVPSTCAYCFSHHVRIRIMSDPVAATQSKDPLLSGEGAHTPTLEETTTGLQSQQGLDFSRLDILRTQQPGEVLDKTQGRV